MRVLIVKTQEEVASGYGPDLDIPNDLDDVESLEELDPFSDHFEYAADEGDDDTECATESSEFVAEALDEPEPESDDALDPEISAESKDTPAFGADVVAESEAVVKVKAKDTALSEISAEYEAMAKSKVAAETVVEIKTDPEGAANPEVTAAAQSKVGDAIIAALPPYNHQGILEIFAQAGIALITPEQVHQEFRKADVTALPMFSQLRKSQKA